VSGVRTSEGLSIAQVAAEAQVPVDTLRYYERSGLLAAPPRTSGSHRRYPADVIDRLRFIRGAQRLGLRLAEIRDLLSVRDTGVCPCEPAEVMLRRHLAEVDAEIARLSQLRGELTAMLTGMTSPTCTDPQPGTWCPPPTDPAKGGDCS
jgi:MerR family transcriptional regulator, mercuric resistance operon regulatory protein